MALRNIVLDGDPVLKKKARPVTVFDDRLGELIDDMAETMSHAYGLGLAAPQVGVLRRVFVALDESDRPEDPEAAQDYTPTVREFINPEIIETEGEVSGYEGCLSFPGRTAVVARPLRAVVRAQDRTGKTFTFEGKDMMARCLCHETDHLNGVTIDDVAEYFLEDTYEPEDEEIGETIKA